jgi:hypothetical protein
MAKQTEEQKAAMIEGRKAATAVRLYLEALDRTKPRRGRPKQKTMEQLDVEIEALRAAFDAADPMGRLPLLKKLDKVGAEIRELQEEEAAEEMLAPLAKEFIQCAAGYSERHGTLHHHWLAVRVPPEVLAEAGIEPAPK